ncbi:phage tail spike protein [Nesterenkonia haasae]|uniref:phage tail spike protein n=1 Tax=Nesterenkonia haasae TaxID=2587813 RepID=UPI0013919C5B|nr:phage tail spike protein [Nesterenkonia haasae]NDK31175.1 hypothetical protein [Nesterenkonia haasae]
MSSHGTKASVGLLGWNGNPIRVMQGADWVLEDREDSTNQLRVTVSLASAEGVKTEQEVIFKGRKFAITGLDRDRADDLALLIADEVQAELADLILPTFKSVAWTLEAAMEAALQNTRWTIGSLNGARFPVVDFEEISVLEALQFLARHQDARLVFDSLRRRVSILEQPGQLLEKVFTYGRQLTNIEKEERAPKTTVIRPTGADGLTIASVNNGVPYVEDYGYYTSQGISLSNARARYKKEDYWEETRYEDAENLKRDALNRLKDEAHPQITYTLTAAATTAVDGEDDFDLGELHLGDQVHVWDQQIDAKLKAEVTAVTTSSDSSQNQLVLSYLPESLNAGTEGRYFGDSGNPHGDSGRSGFQPRPSMPILESLNRVGGGLVRWNGQDHDGNTSTIPARFGTIETRVAKLIDGAIPSPDSDEAFSGTSISERGGGIASVAFGGGGEFAVWFYMVGRDGRTRSEYSEPLVIEVEALVDTDAMRDELDAAEERLDGLEGIMGGYDGNISDLNKELEDLGEFLANGDVDADSWSVGGRIMGRDIIGQTFAGAAAAFLRLTSENIEAGAIQTRHLAIADLQNHLNDDALWEFRESGTDSGIWSAGSGEASGWATLTTQTQGPVVLRYNTSDHVSGEPSSLRFVPTGQGVPVRPGDSFYLTAETWVAAGSTGNLRLYARYSDSNGGNVTHEEIGLITSGGIAHEWEVPAGSHRRMELEFWAEESGSSNGQMGSFRFRRKHGAELLVDGAITTRKLYITEEMVAELGKFLKIKVGELGANEIEGMSIIGGTIEGTVMRGNLFETTATPNRGIKFDTNNFRAWDSNNNLRTQVSATTGNLTATGSIRTNFSGNMVEIYDDGDGGNIRFHSGSARSSIKSRHSAGRLSMVYNELDGNASDLPFVGVEADKAILQYRSQVIMVGRRSSGAEYLELDGSPVTVRGNIDMRNGRTQYRYGNAAPLAFVGNRPEEGSSPHFEIRVEEGPLRLSASRIDARAIDRETTSLSANVHVNQNGWLRRVSSASRYKLDQKALNVPDTILDISLRDWVDKAEAEAYAELLGKPRPFSERDQEDYDAITMRRVPGVVAEEVADLGGDQFVVYGQDGQAEEVMYDRLSLAQIQAILRLITQQQEHIDALTDRVSTLEEAS